MIRSTILIVDDDEVDRKAATRALGRAGWQGEIVQVCDAEQARERLAVRRFDCILLDYQLPGTDGLELLTELRATLGVQTPVVMLTGEGNEMVAVEAMKRGAFDYLPKTLLAPDALLRVITQAVERQRLQAELAKAQAQLEYQALYDGLTDLGNRSLFRRDLVRRIGAAHRRSGSFCLLMMDLDRFKAANDTYGHDAGDAVLAEVGGRLARVGRAFDVFYRLGGDEFTGLVEADSAEEVLPLVQRIRAVLAAPIAFGDVMLNVGVSVGIARYPADGSAPEDLQRAADAAMYQAKRSGEGYAFQALAE